MQAIEGRVGRSLQKLIEGQQLARLVRLLLAMHFLQAEDICPDTLELGTHDRDPFGERWLLVGPVVEVLDVEGRESDGGHGAPPGATVPPS